MREIVQLYGILIIFYQTETQDSYCNLVKVFREV